MAGHLGQVRPGGAGRRPGQRLAPGLRHPAGQYAAVEQSDIARDKLVGALVAGGEPDGSSDVAGQAWERVQGDKSRALVLQNGGGTTVLTGTASYEELAELAQALK